MNPSSEDILYVNFNQDSSSLSVGTKKGYQLYTVAPNDELTKLYENSQLEDVFIVERLFSSSLIIYVTLNSPRKLKVCHFQKQQEICSQSYPNSILAVRLNRTRLVVCLEESLYIHNIRDMKVLHLIRDTPPNPAGICELCANEISYLAYPGSVQNGEVQIFDACNLQAVTMLTAHSGRIAALKFNADGSKLATASEKGTVIKVFQMPTGEKLFEFRRGVKRYASIYSMAFSPPSFEPSLLCCSSSTETVHVFKLEHKEEHHQHETTPRQHPDSSEESAGVQGWVSYVSKTAVSYLPSTVSDMLQQGRAFAQAHLPRGGPRSVCALSAAPPSVCYTAAVSQGSHQHSSASSVAGAMDDQHRHHQRHLRLLVASLDGCAYTYDVDLDDGGGECVNVKQTRLLVATGGSGGVPSASSSSKEPSAPTTLASAIVSTAPTSKKMSMNEEAEPKPTVTSQFDGLNLDDEKEFPPMAHTSG